MAPDAPTCQLVFDCDPGIDDALALAVVAHAVRTGRATLAAMVAVGGNVALDHTAANVAFLCNHFGLTVPTFAGAAEPLNGAMPGDATHVHGADGIGGLRRAGQWTMPAEATPGQLVDLLADLDPAAGPRVLLATGPLTNVARMVQVDPTLARHVDRVVVMGGAFGDPAGNVTEHAEFNVWIDPEAWSIVAGAGLPLEVVPLDVTTKVVLTRGDLDALCAPDGSPSLVGSLVSSGIDLYDALLGTPLCEMHDPLAAAAVFDPDLLAWTEGSVSVLLDGEQRGHTVLDRSAASERSTVRVALGVDAVALRDHLLQSLAAVAD
jgi:inosine-uridine nucleoside N-ribohydrolase